VTIYPNVSSRLLAGKLRTALAASEIYLFKAISSPLSVSTTLNDFTECDFSGYALVTVANFGLPYLDPAGGATIATPSTQFNFVTPVLPALPVTNVVLGFWIVDSTGELVVAGTFDAPVAMAADGDAIPLQVLMNFCRN